MGTGGDRLFSRQAVGLYRNLVHSSSSLYRQGGYTNQVLSPAVVAATTTTVTTKKTKGYGRFSVPAGYSKVEW